MEFKVKPSRISTAVSGLEDSKFSMDRYYNSISAVKSKLSCMGNSGSRVRSRLGEILGDIEDERDALGKMEDALDEIVRLYSSYEKNIAEADVENFPVMAQINTSDKVSSDTSDYKPEKITFENSVSNGMTNAVPEDIDAYKPEELPKTEKETDWDYINGKLLDLIACWGLPGSLASVVGGFGINGAKDAGNWVSAGSLVKDIVGAGAEAVMNGNTKAAWKDAVFGLGDGLENVSSSASFGSNFKKALVEYGNELEFDASAGKAAKVKTVTAWAGHVLTAADNLVENVQEWREGGISAVRAGAETVVETAVDIGMGAVATAAVSAGAAALVSAGVIAGAPAIVVGAAAAGVVWAANGVCELITGGDDIGEVVADAVCDVGECTVKAVKDIGNSIKNGLSSAWNSVFA